MSKGKKATQDVAKGPSPEDLRERFEAAHRRFLECLQALGLNPPFHLRECDDRLELVQRAETDYQAELDQLHGEPAADSIEAIQADLAQELFVLRYLEQGASEPAKPSAIVKGFHWRLEALGVQGKPVQPPGPWTLDATIAHLDSLREWFDRTVGPSPETSPPNAVKQQATQHRRPAYGRDHKWLEWKEKEGMTPATIRDRWNKMSDDERRRICPQKWQPIESENGREGTRDLVEKALRKARKDQLPTGEN